MTTQPEALRLADDCDEGMVDFENTAAELRRLHLHEVSNSVWLEKTEWVQETAKPFELGMHRADVLKQRIDRLHEVNQELLEALKVAACEIADWGSYASEYFQDKHDLQGAIGRANAAIAKAGEQP